VEYCSHLIKKYGNAIIGEHIIRNENEYQLIVQYIINNPSKWGFDKLNGGSSNVVMETQLEYNPEIWMV